VSLVSIYRRDAGCGVRDAGYGMRDAAGYVVALEAGTDRNVCVTWARANQEICVPGLAAFIAFAVFAAAGTVFGFGLGFFFHARIQFVDNTGEEAGLLGSGWFERCVLFVAHRFDV